MEPKPKKDKLIQLYEQTIAVIIVIFSQFKYYIAGALALVILITGAYFALTNRVDEHDNFIMGSIEDHSVEDTPTPEQTVALDQEEGVEAPIIVPVEMANELFSAVEKGHKVGVEVYALYADDHVLGYTLKKEDIESTLKRVEELYIEDAEGTEILEISLKEDLSIKKELIPVAEQKKILSAESLYELILIGTNEKRIHIVQSGDTFWDIASAYGISVSDVEKANPNINPSRLQLNQEVSLIVPKPLLTVVTMENATYSEPISYEVQYVDDATLYKGQSRIKVDGRKGKMEINANIYRENGEIVSREILTETQVANPVTKVVARGTKDPPPRKGTGIIKKPTSRGYLTSPFGMRWGRRHNGIDIGLPVGSSILAADGGVVTYSGWNGSYGLLVIIDHGENKETYYAHNSKLLVKVGDKVFQGEEVAKSGNTGNSTGPHLHFEVRVNGVPQNPLNYVKY